jgi:haloalkane dehalogenase
MKILRTPDEHFANLPGYSFAPNYLEVGGVRIHYLDEGPRDAQPIVLMHGEPSWSYLYRKMIPLLSKAGHRVIAPDLVGFGRSDKPSERSDYTYQKHVDWMWGVFHALGLQNITLFCQDWGGLIGLRLVAEHPECFARVIASNTFLPTGDMPMPKAFLAWQEYSQTTPEFKIGKVVRGGCAQPVTDEVVAAYDAPFPDESYKEGARQFPTLVPTSPTDPASDSNRKAWESLQKFEKPFLTLFGEQDKITRGAEQFFHAMVPGCKGQAHQTLPAGGHFIQEDCGEELAALILTFMGA